MATKIGIAILLSALIPATTVFAHGNETHLMGTVEAVEYSFLVVKTHEGKSHSIGLNADTKYERYRGGAATAAEVRVGDRVVVDADGEAQNLTASRIRSSHPKEHSEGGERPHEEEHGDGQ